MTRIVKKLIIPFVMLLFVVASFFIAIIPFAQQTHAVIGEDTINFYQNNSILIVDKISDWQRLTKLPKDYNYTGKTLVLNCDIDVAMYPSPTQKFNGILEGNNHNVFNAKAPLFQEIGTSGEITNLNFHNVDTKGRAVVALTNKGILSNVSASGKVSSSLFGGFVLTNNGTVQNCFSYLTINDSTTSTMGDFAGVVGANYGTIISSHYCGEMNLSNQVNAGGIVALNVGVIKKCSAKIVANIFTTKNLDEMSVGGLVGTNGYDSQNIGTISNSFAFVETKYSSDDPLNFETRPLMVSGLIGKSIFTDMSYCYSNITGEGKKYGIVSHLVAEEVEGLITPEEPEEPYIGIVGYNFNGSENIEYCFSTSDLTKTHLWSTDIGNIEETLPTSNEKITDTQLLNSDGVGVLLSLLQNSNAIWLGTSGQYPIVSGTIFEEKGTIEHPFLIKQASDIYKLKFFLYNESLNYYFSQVADIDFHGINNLPFDMGGSFASNYNGNDFVIYNYSANALFEKNIGTVSRLGFIGGNKDNVIVLDNTGGSITNSYTDSQKYGTLHTKENIFGGREFVLSETFGYTDNVTFTNIAKDFVYSSGDGSQANPFVITTKAQLASIGSIGTNQYVVLANDIKINSSNITDKQHLNILGFSGKLDGKNHSIIGLLNEPLIVGTLTGQIKNLNVRGIVTGLDNTGMLANSIANLGKAENVNIYGSVAGTQNGGITGYNSGTLTQCRNFATISGLSGAGIAGQNESIIEKSSNFGRCSIGITNNTETGAIQNAFDKSSTQAIYNDMGILNSSLRKTDLMVELWHDNTKIYEEESFPILAFRTFPQYSIEIWGYAIGTNTCPEIKYDNRIYKNDNAKSYFETVMNNNRVYSPIVSTIINTIEYDLVVNNAVRNQITFEWFYNDVAFNKIENPYIVEVGTYKVHARFPGNEYTFEYIHIYSLKISKALLPQPLFDGEGQGIAGLTKDYYYDGGEYDLYQIKAHNLESIGVTENDYTYTVSKNGQPHIGGIKDAGIYNLTIKISNNNYTEFNSSTILSILKSNLTITVENKEIDYLMDIPIFDYAVNVQTNVGTDVVVAEGVAKDAIMNAEEQLICDYVVGDDIGDYEVGFEVSLPNYVVHVNNGVLTVLPILLSTEHISYENAEKVYTGYEISLLPIVDDVHISTQYLDNNNNKNVGEYEIRASFSKQNYTSIELVATLKIVPAVLTIKPENKEISFGSPRPQFNLENIEFLGTDTVTVLNGTASFVCDYMQGNDADSYDIVVSGFSATNYEITYEIGALTVKKAYMTNIFQYNDASYVYDGEAKLLTIDLLGYDITVEYLYYYDAAVLDGFPIDSGIYTATAFVQPIGDNYRSTPFSATLTITKGEITVSFDESYSIDYDGQYHNIDYEGILPNTEEWTILQTGRNAQLVLYSQFKDAGVYNITTVFSGHRNYNNKTLTTKLTINKRTLEVVISQNAIYNRQNCTPEYSFDGDIVADDVININWEYSMLGYGYDNVRPNVVNAGSYTTYPKSQNENYQIVNEPTFTIERLKVPFVPNYVEYSYGDYIDFVFNDRNYTSTRGSIIQRNFYIGQTVDNIDVEYYYSGPGVGTYNVTSIKNTSNYVFEFLLESGINKVRVVRRQLTHSWNEVVFEREYNGSLQQPFIVTIGNVVSGESVSTIIKSNGNLKDAGNYNIWVDLSASPNYSLESSIVELVITKAPLTIKANSITAVKGTNALSFTATVTGLQGNDTIASMGKQLIYNCTYSNTSPIGITLPISITEFELNNYDITFITGDVDVTANQYPVMTMSSDTFIYDGNPKALKTNEASPSGSTISFVNNYKTNVGKYTVTANIIFPNSTTQTLTAVLTITKATPILFVEDLIIPYSIVAKLKNNDIIGEAKVNDKEVEGLFSFVSTNKSLLIGTNSYEVVFTPTNTQNLSTAFANINIEGKMIRKEVLAFDSETVIITEKDIHITEATGITLKETYDNLQLFLNGQLTEKINLTTTGVYKIEIKYDDNLVFSQTYNVTLKKSEENVDDETIPEGIEILNIVGGYFKDSGKILVKDGECYITIKEEYPNTELFLNGQSVTTIVLYGKEGQAKIEIKYDGLLILSQTFGVVVPIVEIIEEPTDNWLWAKIIGGIVGGLGLVALSFLLTKKIINKRKKAYNPYDAVEKKKKKFKKYQ